jgi:hypothetical protein
MFNVRPAIVRLPEASITTSGASSAPESMMAASACKGFRALSSGALLIISSSCARYRARKPLRAFPRALLAKTSQLRISWCQ